MINPTLLWVTTLSKKYAKISIQALTVRGTEGA